MNFVSKEQAFMAGAKSHGTPVLATAENVGRLLPDIFFAKKYQVAFNGEFHRLNRN